MRVVIEGFYGGKVQVFSSKLKKGLFGWLFRATYVSFKNGFAKSFDIPDVQSGQTTIGIPGPLNVRLSWSIQATSIRVDYSVEPDGVMLSLFNGSIDIPFEAKKKFKAKAFGNTIEGVIRLEP